MKSHHEIVKERYECSGRDISMSDNIYSLINPVGFHNDRRLRNLFFRVFRFFRNSGLDVSDSTILDLGCGKGSTTRMFCEFTAAPRNIYGLDLSQYRIECASKMNSNISYRVGDILELPEFPVVFDIITALDVFMHISGEGEIIKALQNIHGKLAGNGYFLWYYAFAKNHFETTPGQDHSGFHPLQMEKFAEKAGFRKVKQINLYKRIFWRYHSLYLVTKIPVPLVTLLEFILPGSPGNMLMVFKKTK